MKTYEFWIGILMGTVGICALTAVGTVAFLLCRAVY